MRSPRAVACCIIATIHTLTGVVVAEPSPPTPDIKTLIGAILDLENKSYNCKENKKVDYEALKTKANKTIDQVETLYHSHAEPPEIAYAVYHIGQCADRVNNAEDALAWHQRALPLAKEEQRRINGIDNTDLINDITNEITKLKSKSNKIAAAGHTPREDSIQSTTRASSTRSTLMVSLSFAGGLNQNSFRKTLPFFPSDPESLPVANPNDPSSTGYDCREASCEYDHSAQYTRSFERSPSAFVGLEGAISHVSEDRELSISGAGYLTPDGYGMYAGLGYGTSSDPFQLLCWRPYVRLGGSILVGTTILRTVARAPVDFNGGTLVASKDTEVSTWIGPHYGFRAEFDFMLHRNMGIGFHPSVLVSLDSQITFWFPIVFRLQKSIPLRNVEGTVQ